MPLSLHTIKPAKGATKKRKRVGRGNASGHGTYSGRGQKGQRSRSGGKSGLKRKGMKQILLQTPKLRGFKSDKPKNQPVNLSDLNKNFKDGAKINPSVLLKLRLIDTIKEPVKILGKGELKIKNLEFSDVKLSKSVEEQLKKMGGKVKK
ncbi:MAG: 50S ribosomal protein L15 [Patescibacteria group bacterium]|jgi:large subunit ribosomal protein L15